MHYNFTLCVLAAVGHIFYLYQRDQPCNTLLHQHKPCAVNPSDKSFTTMDAAEQQLELFVCGRLCLFGEHSDWAGAFRRCIALANKIPLHASLNCISYTRNPQ